MTVPAPGPNFRALRDSIVYYAAGLIGIEVEAAASKRGAGGRSLAANVSNLKDLLAAVGQNKALNSK